MDGTEFPTPTWERANVVLAATALRARFEGESSGDGSLSYPVELQAMTDLAALLAVHLSSLQAKSPEQSLADVIENYNPPSEG